MYFKSVRRAALASAISLSLIAQHAVAQTAEPAPVAAAPAPEAATPAPVAAAPAPVAATPNDQQWQQELALWQAASSGNTPEEYKAYLRSYPTGKFADIARSRVAAATPVAAPVVAAPVQAPAPVVVEAPPPPPPAYLPGTPATEDGLLDRVMRREVQGRLTSLGFATGGADGVFGDQTRTAISRWQAAIGAPSTGYLNYDQFQRLRQDSQGAYEAWLNQQLAARKRVVHRPDRVLEGRVPNNNNDDAAAALALGLIGGALIGGAIAGGGGHHHGGGRGPGPGRCPPGMPCR
jgi:Putative peptidoglycan binding domain